MPQLTLTLVPAVHTVPDGAGLRTLLPRSPIDANVLFANTASPGPACCGSVPPAIPLLQCSLVCEIPRQREAKSMRGYGRPIYQASFTGAEPGALHGLKLRVRPQPRVRTDCRDAAKI
jgi:hypothetical protein